MRTKHGDRLEDLDLKILRREGAVQSYYKRKRPTWFLEEIMKFRPFPQRNLRFGETQPIFGDGAHDENQNCAKQFLHSINECSHKVVVCLKVVIKSFKPFLGPFSRLLMIQPCQAPALHNRISNTQMQVNVPLRD